MDYSQLVVQLEEAVGGFNQRHSNLVSSSLHRNMVSAFYAISNRLSTFQHHTQYLVNINDYVKSGIIKQNNFDYVDQHLFGFFYSGLSAIECLVYGVYVACKLIEPKKFHLSESDVTIEKAIKDFSDYDFSTPFSSELANLMCTCEYKEWKIARNALTHRGQKNHFTISGVQNQTQQSNGWSGKLHLDNHTELPLDEKTTEDRFAWLLKTLDLLAKPGVVLLLNI